MSFFYHGTRDASLGEFLKIVRIYDRDSHPDSTTDDVR